MIAANIAMIATTQTISMNVKPSSRRTRSALPACDVGGIAGAALLSIRPVRDEIISPVLPRQSVDVRIAPRIGGNQVALQVGSIPGHGIARPLHQGGEALR